MESLFGEVEGVEVKVDRILQRVNDAIPAIQAIVQALAALRVNQIRQDEKLDRIIKALEPPPPAAFRVTLAVKE